MFPIQTAIRFACRLILLLPKSAFPLELVLAVDFGFSVDGLEFCLYTVRFGIFKPNFVALGLLFSQRSAPALGVWRLVGGKREYCDTSTSGNEGEERQFSRIITIAN